MNFYKTTAAFGVTACLLMASGAFAAYDGTFDGETGSGSWEGGAITADTVTVPVYAGLPISGATSPSENKVYSISGSASNAYNVAGAPFADMMVKVSVPDEPLSGLEDAEGAKFAVAVDAVANETTGQFKYWNGSQWTPLSTNQFAAGAWVRVTMKFDYGTAKTCTVALNGNTCGTYPLIDNTASTLASVQIKGDTAIDEVVVAQGSVPAFADDTAKVDGATYATKKWLTANDVTWPADSTAAATLDAQYTFGLDPKGTATTLPLSFVQDDDSTKATLSFPGFGAFGGTGTYVLKSSTDKTTWTGNTVVTPSGTGVNTAQINLSELTVGTAKYYRIEASATAPSNN